MLILNVLSLKFYIILAYLKIQAYNLVKPLLFIPGGAHWLLNSKKHTFFYQKICCFPYDIDFTFSKLQTNFAKNAVSSIQTFFSTYGYFFELVFAY